MPSRVRNKCLVVHIGKDDRSPSLSCREEEVKDSHAIAKRTEVRRVTHEAKSDSVKNPVQEKPQADFGKKKSHIHFPTEV